ncbi:MAG: 50S ribosomal protein L24 [Calditrichaceae bacterium]|nr:50S ribosomal protein L24 [Calditrichaceae bacterium]MBN2709090.1 50S ribosomal protein L24 [Calditrichaceae bacterium]RQV97047.1 MAG: 50S ribosomal protein L24 [Calditrichota bacterium]
MKIRKNDTVKIIAGSYKDRGKIGKVLKVFPDKERVIVEGVNIIKRHTRPSQKNQQGGIVEKEAPIHVSNVLYYSNKFNVTTRIGYKRLEDGSKARYCKNPVCQEEIITDNQ